MNAQAKLNSEVMTKPAIKVADLVKLEGKKQSFPKSKRSFKRASGKLRTKPRMTMKLHQLPFIGNDHCGIPRREGVSFWDVPMTGGYFGGNQTGEAIAGMLLYHFWNIRQEDDFGYEDFDLGQIILSMMKRNPTSEEERASLRGQVVGFAAVLTHWLRAAITKFDSNVDKFEMKAALDKASRGLDAEMANALWEKIVSQHEQGSAADQPVKG